METTENGGAGLRAIVFYKLAKSAVQVALALTVLAFIARGAPDKLHDFASAIRHHAAGAWSVQVADLFLRMTSVRALHLTSLALVFDAVLSFVEGWALHRRYGWAPWLVIVATGSLVPLELYETFRHPHVGRLVVLLLNVTIVVYLARRVQKERRAQTV